MWLTFALLSPLFWALVHVLDAHCVDRVFDRPWMGMITSGLASVVAFAAIPFAAPFVVWSVPGLASAGLLVGAGVLVQVSQVLYFQALERTEAGIVAAYWNMVPALLPIAGFLVQGEVLAPVHSVGIAVLIAASACFSLLDANRAVRWSSFFLMLTASGIQVGAILMMKSGYDHTPFFVGFLLVTLGIVLTGAAPLINTRVRATFTRNLTRLKSAVWLILGIEVANLVALFMSQRAIDLGIPSLVAAVETTIPAYTFGLSLILATWSRFGDRRAGTRLPLKLALVAVTIWGVILVSDGHDVLLAQ